MNYYDELKENIDHLIQLKDYDQAKSLILSDLKLPYVPKDILNYLKDSLKHIEQLTRVYKSLSDDDIESYLFQDENHQLLAVDELNKRNLRDYIDICASYLKNGTYKNAKALLIDSLIRQEINHVFLYNQDGFSMDFNPIQLKIVEETEGYLTAYHILVDTYMKEPSLFKMANDLLYKECLLSLPVQLDNNNGSICANKIIKYINDAFNC